MAESPLCLPTSFHSETERDWRMANTINLLIRLLAQSGPTADRPPDPHQGMMYFDTDLRSPIWWSGTIWVWPTAEQAPS